MEYWKDLSLEDLEGEEWRDIPNSNGKYMASNFGRIKSLSRKCKVSIGNKGYRIIRERIRKQTLTDRGYLRIRVAFNEGVQETKSVHRLIAFSFIPNPKDKPTVNHINGIRDDNKIENLEWATDSEQQIHAHKIGLRVSKFGEEHPMSKLNEFQVRVIRKIGHDIPYTQTARMFKVDPALIRRIVLNIIWKNV